MGLISLPATCSASCLYDAQNIAHFRVGFVQPATRRRPRVITPTTGLIWILAGAGELRFDHRSFPLKQGDVFLRIANLAHGQYLDHDDHACIAFCALPAGSLAPLHHAQLISPEKPVVSVGLHPDLIEAWGDLHERCEMGDPGPLLCAQALQTMTELLQRSPETIDPDTAFLHDAHRLLRRHACDRRPLENLVDNQPYISWRQRFLRLTGISPGQFRIQARMQRAKELLRGSALSIKQIATVCGYDDVHNFARQFKAHHQQTPAQWRRDLDQA